MSDHGQKTESIEELESELRPLLQAYRESVHTWSADVYARDRGVVSRFGILYNCARHKWKLSAATLVLLLMSGWVISVSIEHDHQLRAARAQAAADAQKRHKVEADEQEQKDVDELNNEDYGIGQEVPGSLEPKTPPNVAVKRKK